MELRRNLRKGSQKLIHNKKSSPANFNERDAVLTLNAWKATCQGRTIEMNYNGPFSISKDEGEGSQMLTKVKQKLEVQVCVNHLKMYKASITEDQGAPSALDKSPLIRVLSDISLLLKSLMG